MKAWIYYILISVIFISGVSTGIYFNHGEKPTKPNTPTPPAAETTYTYVSLGDSIAEGYGLAGYESKNANDFVEGSYASALKNSLETKYAKFNAYNYAKAGQTSTQLLEMLTTLLGTELSSENQQKKDNIQAANTITICIGANDILGPAQTSLYSLVMGNDISSIVSALDSGLATFASNFPSIVSTLRTLNANAKLIFSNIYNPYKEFITTNHDLDISTGFMPMTFQSEKFNVIGQMAEAYIDGDVVNDVSKNPVKTIAAGLNQIIESTLSGMSKCSMLDVKAVYDSYFTDNSKYDVIQCSVLSMSTIEIVNIGNITAELLGYLDPHPTSLGHQKIASLFTSSFINSLG